MKSSINLLQLAQTPIYQQLQIEEALLRADDQNWCLLNYGSSPAIVMGISGQVEQLVEKTSTIPVIRRFSGGGTVVVDENTLFVTVICNKRDIDIAPYPKPVLEWNGDLYRKALEGHPFFVRENDYVLGDRKFGGNAQYLSKERWLHHSTLLWDFDFAKMECLKIPQKMPEYRQKRDHTDFLCSLNKVLAAPGKLFEGIVASLSTHFTIKTKQLLDLSEILDHPHRKQTVMLSKEKWDSVADIMEGSSFIRDEVLDRK